MEGETARKLASVFDSYQRQLKWQKLLDYDDLLHHCLALVHNNPAVSSLTAPRAKAHDHTLQDRALGYA
jgi:superfamily I DNA/RNA helicase